MFLEIINLLNYIDQLFDLAHYNLQPYKPVLDKYIIFDKNIVEILLKNSGEVSKRIFENLSFDKLNHFKMLIFKLQDTIETLNKKMEIVNRSNPKKRMDKFSFSVTKLYYEKIENLNFKVIRLFELKNILEAKSIKLENFELNQTEKKINANTKLAEKKANNSSQLIKAINLEFFHLDEHIENNFNLTSTPRFRNNNKEVIQNSKRNSNSNTKFFESSFSENEDEKKSNLLSKMAQNSFKKSRIFGESKKTVSQDDKQFRSIDSGVSSFAGAKFTDGQNPNLTANLTLISDFNSTSYSTPPLSSSCNDYQDAYLGNQKLSKSLPNLNKFNSIQTVDSLNKRVKSIIGIYSKDVFDQIDESDNLVDKSNELIIGDIPKQQECEKFEKPNKNNKKNIMYKYIRFLKIVSKRCFYYGNFFILILIVIFFLICFPIILPKCCDFQKEFLIFNEKKYDNDYVPF